MVRPRRPQPVDLTGDARTRWPSTGTSRRALTSRSVASGLCEFFAAGSRGQQGQALDHHRRVRVRPRHRPGVPQDRQGGPAARASAPARCPAACSRPASASPRPASRRSTTPSRSTCAKAVREHDVDVIDTSEVEITSGREEGPVAFDATLEVRPEVTVPGYGGPARRAAGDRRRPTRRSTPRSPQS